jgi:hypothetical protein
LHVIDQLQIHDHRDTSSRSTLESNFQAGNLDGRRGFRNPYILKLDLEDVRLIAVRKPLSNP